MFEEHNSEIKPLKMLQQVLLCTQSGDEVA
jgi:hypothetical protein